MKLKRYYTDKNFSVNDSVILDGDEFHHLNDVMRTRVNDEVVLFNGTPYNYFARVVEINKNNARLLVENCEENGSELEVNVTLFQAVCKGEKLSLITQKITELGAKKLSVFYSKFTDIKDKTSRLDKLEKVSISACKQCGGSVPILIDGVKSFEDMIEEAKGGYDKVFVAYENADGRTLNDALKEKHSYKSIGLIIGAEGGFSEEEVEKMLKSNFEIVSLGKRILRTETASITGVANIIFNS